MSDKLNPSTPEPNDKDSASHPPMDATWTGEPEPLSPVYPEESGEDFDYGATVTGTPIPADDYDEFDTPNMDLTIVPPTTSPGAFPAEVDDNIGATFVRSDETNDEDQGDDGADDGAAEATGTVMASTQPGDAVSKKPLDPDSTFVATESDVPSGDPEDSMATLVPTSDDDSSAQGSFGATVTAEPVSDDSPDFRTIINQSGRDIAADRGGDLSATNPLGTDPAAKRGQATISASNSGVKGSSSRLGSGTGQGSKVSQIWSASTNSSLDELISIRARPVAEAGQTHLYPDADFEIVEKLAEGGMGVVYVARQRSLNRELAIKTLKTGAGTFSGTVGKSKSGRAASRAERQKREMFLSEALVTANLVHPNIIPIHELAETGEGMPYYVMKRVHGIPWNKRICEMSLEENLDVMHKVCDAIAYAHHSGVINRDLKPENVMLGEFGEVLVLDWGLAVPAPHAAEKNFRSPVASFGAGTPAYMSPELWTGPPEAIGECSDIYLLGAILFEIVTGKAPHDFPRPEKGAKVDVWKTIDSVLRDNLIQQTTESGELLDVALKAMRSNPEERYGSVLELQFAIRNFERHEESRHLSRRATELIESQVAAPRNYHTCQTSAALYEESLRMWPQNTAAKEGLRTTRLAYAKLASDKGDYDLGLQVAAQEDDPEFVTLTKQLRSAKRIRSGVKWTALAAMLCVVGLGAKSIYDNGIITNLNAEVDKKQEEAQVAVQQANNAKEEAADAAAKAAEALIAASEAERDATESKKAAMLAQKEAETFGLEAKIASKAAAEAQILADESQKMATAAITKAQEANDDLIKANEQMAIAKDAAKEADVQRRKSEILEKVARVEIQSQSIRGLTLTGDYADALREVDRLLDSTLLPELPPEQRDQRTAELQAQRELLLRRTRQSEEPAQTQAASPDGKWLALGDATGLVVVLANPSESMNWPDAVTYQLSLVQPISCLRFVDKETLLVAAGNGLWSWRIDEADPSILEGHEAKIQGLDVLNDLAVSGDESGHLIVWNLTTGSKRAELKANTSIRDVALIPGTPDFPGTRNFVYAGARGGQSADVLAYRIPKVEDKPDLVRLGQLKMSRQHNYPPARLSVSPDGSLLVISNSTNGDLFALNRVPAGPDSRKLGFPFAHPADLKESDDMTWLLSQHSRPVNDLQWSGDSRSFLTASDDRRIGVWLRTNPADAGAEENGGLVFQRFLQGHGARVTQARFLDAAASLVSSTSADGFTRLWNLRTLAEEIREIRKAFDPLQDSAAPASTSRIHERSFFGSSQYILTSAYSGETVAPESDLQGKAVIPTDDGETVVLNENSPVHRGSVRAVQFSDDGSQLVSGAADGSIVVWDVNSHSPVSGPEALSQALAGERFKEGHEFNISRMRIVGANNDVLATAGFDGSLRLWNLNTRSGREGVQQQVIVGLGLVNTFAASPDGQFLVTSSVSSGGDGKTSERVKAEPGNLRRNPTTAALPPVKCSVWKLSELLTSTVASPFLNLTGGHELEVTTIAVSVDSTRIATGGSDGMIVIWDAVTAERLATLRAHGKKTIVTALEWLADGTLISAGLDGKLIRWSIQPTSQDDGISPQKTPPLPFRLIQSAKFNRPKTPIEHIALSPDQKRLLVVSVETERATDRAAERTSYHLDHWFLETPESANRIPLAIVLREPAQTITPALEEPPQTISSAQWSADGGTVLVCTEKAVQVFNSTDWRVSRVFSVGSSGATDAQFISTRDGQESKDQIVTFDGTTASSWDFVSGERLIVFRGPFPVNAVAFMNTPDQRLVLTAGESLRIFEADSERTSFGRPLFRTQKAHAGRITSVATCPSDPTRFLTAGIDGKIILWQWRTDEIRATKTAEVASLERPAAVVRWSPDGERILAATYDGKIVLMNQDGSQSVTLAPAGDRSVELSAAEFSRDGNHVVVAGRIARTSESIGWVLRSSLTNDNEGNVAANAREVEKPREQESGPQTIIECTFSGHEAGGISAVGFVAGTPYLVSGGRDGSLIVWNWENPLPGVIPTAYEAYRFLMDGQATAHEGPITTVSISPGGEICSGSDDDSIILWRLSLLTKGK